jgi:hypothetical protein
VRWHERIEWDPETGARRTLEAATRDATLDPRDGLAIVLAAERRNRGARLKTFENPKRGSPDGRDRAHAETRRETDRPRGPHAERSRKRRRGAAEDAPTFGRASLVPRP